MKEYSQLCLFDFKEKIKEDIYIREMLKGNRISVIFNNSHDRNSDLSFHTVNYTYVMSSDIKFELWPLTLKVKGQTI